MARGIGGGRPYTRGGRGGGGGYRGGSSNYRGNNQSSSYGSRSRYDNYDSRTPSKYQSNDRYAPRRSNDFKRPIHNYRNDDSRDRRGSPDRKRFRRDYSSSNQGSRNQSHDNYGGRGGSTSNDYRHGGNSSSARPHDRSHPTDHQQYERGTRSSYPESRRGNRTDFAYPDRRETRPDRFDPRRSSSSSSRRDSGASSAYRSRDMPPPRAPPPRRLQQQQAPLRPRRGRAGMNGSGTQRSLAMRTAASRIIRGSDLKNPSTMANRRAGYLANRSNRDVLARRIKLAKIRSSNKAATLKETKTPGAAAGEDSKKKKVNKTTKKPQAAKRTATVTAARKEKKKPVKAVSVSKSTSSKKTNGSSVKKSDDEEEDDEEEEATNKSVEANGDETLPEEENDEGADAGEKGEGKKADELSSAKSRYGKSFIKLTCTHCRSNCWTFSEYTNHLTYSRIHKVAMRRLAVKQKTQLSRMRTEQRNAQKNLEEKADDTSDLRPQFCLLCRLNYRQLKEEHQMSEAHKNMKKFLMPYCSTCKISYKSPMAYESHRCSLEHIRKRAFKDNRDKSGDEKELDLENFMTVDSVGDVDLDVANVEFPDDIADESETSSTKEKSATTSSAEKDKRGTSSTRDPHKTSSSKSSSSETINVGSEHIKKVEVLYCGLCRMYLPRREEKELATRRHCGTRSHLRLYIRYRDDKQLREEAEKIHKRHQEEREAAKAAAAAAAAAEKTVKKEPEEGADAAKKAVAGEGKEKESEMDEKMWADVDKDLGDLLREVAPEVALDEDEDGEDSRNNTERYDRFKNSDKNVETKDAEAGAEDEEPKEQRVKTNGTVEEKAAPVVEKSAEVVAVVVE